MIDDGIVDSFALDRRGDVGRVRSMPPSLVDHGVCLQFRVVSRRGVVIFAGVGCRRPRKTSFGRRQCAEDAGHLGECVMVAADGGGERPQCPQGRARSWSVAAVLARCAACVTWSGTGSPSGRLSAPNSATANGAGERMLGHVRAGGL